MADTHTIMPKRLAQALMESSMQHFDSGGAVNPAVNPANTVNSSLPQMPQAPDVGGIKGSGQLAGFMAGAAPGSWLNPQTLLNPLMNNYQAQAPNISMQNFIPGISQQENNQANVYGQQQNLANMLLAQSQGKGPGQALVAQQAGNNAAQQGALMASQRGANANAGLIGRQAAMAGAQGNQQALNTQAELALQSQGALGQQQAAMANQALQAQSILQGGQAAQNTAITQGQLGAQQINANTSAQNSATMGNMVGGALGGGASVLSSVLNKGGEVKAMADGGSVDPYQAGASTDPIGGPINDVLGVANYQSPGAANIPTYQPPATNPFMPQSKGGGGGGGIAGLAALLARGGAVPYGQMLAGGNVPGQAKVGGDSPKNDTVPTMLSPGEDVIPRSITQLPEKEMEQKAVEFLRHLHKGKKGYGSVIEARKQRA